LPGWGYADANADSYRYSDHHTQRDSNVHADSDAKCDSECHAKSNSAAAADPAPPPNAAVTCKSFFCRGSSQLPLQIVWIGN
jgi:hypothetical protein